MTPVEALRELVEGVDHEDEIAKRLWERGHLGPLHVAPTLAEVDGSYCPLARYIHAETGVRARIGVEAWYGARGSGSRGHLPAVLRRFVQAYDNGDYDNLI